jgi:MFS transporter, ACDE family, multidrug resistance protein
LVLALGVLGLTASSALMLTAAVLFGTGMGLIVPTLTVQVGEQSQAEVRGRATALLASVTFAGQVLAPMVLGPVHSATSVRGVFLTAATLAAVTLALVATLRRSSRTACSSYGLPRPYSGCAPPRW